jgi:HAD superfamily hydrolase (TIGR01509 family)
VTPCGYIFDFDGVLVNTMEAHFAAHSQALAEAGVPIDRVWFFNHAGTTRREMLAYFCRQAGKVLDVEALYRRKCEIAKQYAGRATAIACNLELLRTLRQAGVPVAIVSGSSRPSIRPLIARFGIEVDAVVSTEDVERGKPHPDLCLEAAEKLGLAPGDCTVVEDSDVGIEAAQRAGMKALRFFDNQRVIAPDGAQEMADR